MSDVPQSAADAGRESCYSKCGELAYADCTRPMDHDGRHYSHLSQMYWVELSPEDLSYTEYAYFYEDGPRVEYVEEQR